MPFALRVSTTLKMTGARSDAIRNLQTTIYRTVSNRGRPLTSAPIRLENVIIQRFLPAKHEDFAFGGSIVLVLFFDRTERRKGLITIWAIYFWLCHTI